MSMKKSVNKLSWYSQSLKQPIRKICTDYYAQSRGGADGLVKYPRDKVPVVFRGVSEIKNFYCYKHVLEGKIVVLTKGS